MQTIPEETEWLITAVDSAAAAGRRRRFEHNYVLYLPIGFAAAASSSSSSGGKHEYWLIGQVSKS